MKIVRRLMGIAFCATLFACMGGGGGVHLVNIYASPDVINEGESTTLSWSSPGGATVLSSDFDAGSASGSTTVSPTSSTTYHIKVRLASNDIVSENTTVIVYPASTEEKRKP